MIVLHHSGPIIRKAAKSGRWVLAVSNLAYLVPALIALAWCAFPLDGYRSALCAFGAAVLTISVVRELSAPHAGTRQWIVGPAGWLLRYEDEETVLAHVQATLQPAALIALLILNWPGSNVFDVVVRISGWIILIAGISVFGWKFIHGHAVSKLPVRVQYERRAQPWSKVWEVQLERFHDRVFALHIFGPKSWVGRTELFAITMERDPAYIDELLRRINSWIRQANAPSQ